MNLKTKVFGLIAALAMFAALTGPALADNPSASTTLTVGTVDNGSFGIAFDSSASDFGSVDTSGNNLSTAYTLYSFVKLVITDTQTVRPDFWVAVSNGNFTNQQNAYTIPANNLFVNAVYNPEQGRWSSQGNGHVGDIGLMAPNKECCHFGSQQNGVPFYWTHDNQIGPAGQYVANGYAGSGTIQTTQLLSLGLNIPVAQPPGAYSTTLYATVYYNAP